MQDDRAHRLALILQAIESEERSFSESRKERDVYDEKVYG
jgi:hypothetical protein